jgi:uncharacterized protein (UPF0332 family)
MSPEAIDYMTVAETALTRARRNFAAELYEDTARNAYLAALNAARAIIFDKTMTAPKTHAGARSNFHDLVRQGLQFDSSLTKFLSEGFEMEAERGLRTRGHLSLA